MYHPKEQLPPSIQLFSTHLYTPRWREVLWMSRVHVHCIFKNNKRNQPWLGLTAKTWMGSDLNKISRNLQRILNSNFLSFQHQVKLKLDSRKQHSRKQLLAQGSRQFKDQSRAWEIRILLYYTKMLMSTASFLNNNY